jgi:hypothetical protein
VDDARASGHPYLGPVGGRAPVGAGHRARARASAEGRHGHVDDQRGDIAVEDRQQRVLDLVGVGDVDFRRQRDNSERASPLNREIV